MPALADLQAFNLDEASVSLWASKGPTGPSGSPPRYTAHWVETTDDVDVVLKQLVNIERNRIEETIEYGLLVQNNEASAISIPTDETHAPLVVDAVAAETERQCVHQPAQLNNSKFYIIKLAYNDTVIHAIRRTDDGWTTRRARSIRSLVYEENRVTLDSRPRFDIESTIDFFIVGDDILILNKGHFESILRYKEAHRNDFTALQGEAEFAAVFSDLGPLVAYVGENKIRLRRASAIRQKGYYRDPDFMTKLRERHTAYRLTIQFDDHGRIIATAETCGEIITVLLDHRLGSPFSMEIYDVPSTTVA